MLDNILILLLLVLLVFGIIPTMIMSYVIFRILLVRTEPEKWSHSCSLPDDPEIVSMYNAAVEWRNKYENNRKSVEIHNDGLKLYGDFFDFGNDKSVIIMAGRMEACVYSSYFGEPYRRAGYNVLVIDGRAHGLSEGKYNNIGYKECFDVLAWGKWLHENTNTKKIVLHGICIGACTAMFAITNKNCPEYFEGIVVEGMYASFYHSIKNHMKANKRPIFPFMYMVLLYIRIILGANAITDGPKKRIKNLKKPILFIHGKKDAYSLPVKAQEMYDICPSAKRLVWFDKGTHSRLRINNIEEYDNEILKFTGELSLAK